MTEPKFKMGDGEEEEETKVIEQGKIDDQQNEDAIGNSNEAGTSDCDPALAGINLALILSCLSLSAEEREHVQEGIQGEENRLDNNRKGKRVSARSDFLSRKREVNELRAAERQTAKVHTKVRDCRHSRRM